MDVILGSFGTDDSFDHVTFGCRVGHIDDQAEPGATLVSAAVPYTDSAIFGTKLSREDALVHERLDEFWSVVDWVLTEDADVRTHVYS